MDTDLQLINSDSFLATLRSKGEVRNAKVSGTVQLRSLAPTGEPRREGEPETWQAAPCIPHARYCVANVTFLERFVCDGARLEAELVFERCRFDRGFSARGARIETGLDLLRSVFIAPEREYTVCLDGARVEGDLQFRGNRVEGHVGARRMHVIGDASFSGLKIYQHSKPVTDMARLYQAPFGKLDQDFEPVRNELGAQGASLLNLCGSQVDGTLYLGGLPYDESAVLDDPYEFEEDCPEFPMVSVISGRLFAADLTVGRDLVLWNMRVIGDLDLSGAKVGCAVKGQTLVRRKARPIVCQLEVAGNLWMPQTVIGTDLMLDGALIRGDAVCSLCKMTALFGSAVCIERDWYVPLQIGGSLQLSCSEIDFLIFKSAQIRRGLEMITGQLRRVDLVPQLQAVRVVAAASSERRTAPSGSVGAGTYDLRFMPCRLGSIELQSVRVEEDLTLAGVDLRAWGGPSPVSSLQNADRQIRVNNCIVGGRLSLGMNGMMQGIAERLYRGDDPAHRYRRLLGGRRGVNREDVHACDTLLPDRESTTLDLAECRKRWSAMDASCPAEVPGRVELSHNHVGGELDISHLNVGGDIRLDGVKIGRGLLASRFEAGFGGGECGVPIFVTRCTSLSIQNLRCEGDIDLTGIILQAGDQVDPVRSERRGIHGTYASVRGDLLLWSKYPEPEQDPGGQDGLLGADLRAEGVVLDLQGAEIGRLLVSGANFAQVVAAHVARRERWSVHGRIEPRLNLENATIGRFEIKEPVPTDMKLSGISVVKWDLHPDETYLKVLSGTSAFFSGDVYSQVEKSLRNEGKDSLADEVHIQMRKELEVRMWAENKILRWMLSRTHRILTNYGTSAVTPLACIAAIAVVNTALFWDPDNVVASAGYVGALAEKDRERAHGTAKIRLAQAGGTPPSRLMVDITPTDLVRTWGVEDALAMAARFSVPLVSIATSDTWEPADRRPAVRCPDSLLAGSRPQCELPLRVSTIARWLAYLSWIFWPLFIIRVSAFINRRDR